VNHRWGKHLSHYPAVSSLGGVHRTARSMGWICAFAFAFAAAGAGSACDGCGSGPRPGITGLAGAHGGGGGAPGGGGGIGGPSAGASGMAATGGASRAGNGGDAVGGAAAGGGRGGAPVTGRAGAIGTGGAAAGSDGGSTSCDAGANDAGCGAIVACPDAVPTGSCPVDGQTCGYRTTTCTCTAGAWACSACPSTAGPSTPIPSGTSVAPTCGGSVCSYGDLSCACGGCGYCPADRPADGSACGNVKFGCSYGDEICVCTGGAGWICRSPTCGRPSAPSPREAAACASQLTYTCRYATEDQNCNCDSGQWTCSCPGVPPTTGGACVGGPKCAYVDRTCSCTAGSWACDPCPPTTPRPGMACSVQVSCFYTGAGSSQSCHCDGTQWSCP
jgi:hypothetical protein